MTSKLKVLLLVLVVLLVSVSPAFAHDAPEGSEWIMADWMFLSFALFAGVAFVGFLVALKRGWLAELEGEAKQHILEIDEPDYYTTGWSDAGGK